MRIFHPAMALILAAVPITSYAADHAHHDESMAEHLKEDRGAAFDTHFLMVVTHHHRDAVEMSKVAAEKAQHAELRTKAAEIVQKQTAEADQMVAMLKAKGKELSQPHGHFKAKADASKAKLASATGAEVDRVFLDEMIKHHEEGIATASLAKTNAESPELKAMTDTMVRDQQAEVQQMRTWQSQWFGAAKGTEAGHGHAQHEHAQDQNPGERHATVNTACPVCGMAVDASLKPAYASASQINGANGLYIGACSKDHLDQVAANPQTYGKLARANRSQKSDHK